MATQWWTDFLTHYASPYDFNPLNINPLRDHLEKTVDFAKVRALTGLKLIVAATNLQSNGTLLSEMRAIDLVNRLIDSGKLSRDDAALRA
jgi:hypothetical protein